VEFIRKHKAKSVLEGISIF